MGKIIFTGPQIDEAIRKVKAGYADVSKVTAKGSDVRKGKVIVNSNKIEEEGTIEDASVSANVTILSKSYLTSEETNYSIQITPTATINNSGYIKDNVIGEKKVMYIQTEEKTVTPSGEKQIVKPSIGKLLSKVTVEAIPEAPDYPIEKFPFPIFYFYATRSSSSTSYPVAKISQGTVADNIYVKVGVLKDNAKVYLIPVKTGTDTISFGLSKSIFDSVTHRLIDGVITLEPGSSFESLASYVTPKGTFEYKTNGHLIFTFDEDFMCLGTYNATSESSNYAALALFLYDGTTYFAVVIDAEKWSVGSQYIGTKTTGTIRRYTTRGIANKTYVQDGINNYNLQAAGCVFSNYAPIYFEWNYVNDSTAYHLVSMTHGGGTKYYVAKETKKLDDPVVTLNSDVISWSEVEGANKYLITITGSSSYSKTITETSYNLRSTITKGGTYYIKVRASNDVIVSDNSNEVTYILALSPPIITLNQNILSWNTVTDATSYYVYLGDTYWFSTSSTSVDLSAYSLDGGSYVVSVKAYASNWDLSPASNPVAITRLYAPTLVLSEAGILSWVAISGATSYKLEIDGETKANNSTRIYDLNDYIDITTSHTIKVTAYGNNGTFSKTSSVLTGSDGKTIDNSIEVSVGESGAILTDQVVDDTEYPSKFYKLTFNTSGTYYIYSESNYDTYGTLYNSSKEQESTSDDGYGSNFCFCITVNAGDTYYIEARQYSRNVFEFELHVSLSDPNE